MVRGVLRIVRVCTVILLLIVVPSQEGYSVSGKVIAAVMSSDQPRYRDAHRSFVKSLAGRGYPAGTTEIILQSPNPDQLSWSNTVRKFNAYRPDLIVAYGAPAAVTAMKESDGIPVVSVDVYATEKPLKGMCGASSRIPMVTLVRTLHDIRPYQRIGVIYSAREIGSLRQLDDIRHAASQHGMTVVEGNVTSAAALDGVLATMLERCEAIIVTEGSQGSRQFERIVARAAARNTPVIASMPDAADKGGLLSLEINPAEQGHLAAEIAARILEGASPDHLTLLSPRRIDLVVNMRVARQMGITVPFTVLGSATRIIK